MPFEYFKPCPALKAYIHSFWKLTTTHEAQDELHPDGCVDIVLNMGCSFVVSLNGRLLKSHSAYLGGALTETLYEKLPVGVYLLGVRFHPGCYNCFYPPQMLIGVDGARQQAEVALHYTVWLHSLLLRK